MLQYREQTAFLKVYHREVREDTYPGGLAYSVHLACSRDGKQFTALHQNYGILFAEATISTRNTIQPKGIRDPQVFQGSDGSSYFIAGTRVQEDGSKDPQSAGKLLLWKTRDFMTFETMGLLKPEEIDGLAGAGDRIEIPATLCDRLCLHWNKLTNTAVDIPRQVTVRLGENVAARVAEVQAACVYNDGSTNRKPIDWKLDGLAFESEGTYRVSGKVKSALYPFPLAKGYGDPVLFFWNEKWYYISTNDNLNDIGFYIREADTIRGLFEKGIEEHLILAPDRERGFVQTFWAPEFHVIGGKLYLLFAVSDDNWGPKCYLMRAKENGRLISPSGWEEPVRVRKKDGSFLNEQGITLDMTYLKAGGKSYMVWSYRENIGTALDSGSMLCIALVDEERPWQLTSDPVLLSRPLFGWENMEGTINNEGPNGFVKEGKVYLTYSGGSANAYSYAVGLLTAREEDDLLQVSNWKKRSTPVLSHFSVEGEYGPGHNSFFAAEDGNLMIAYHAEEGSDLHERCDGIRRVHFNVSGEPVFDMTAEEDLNPALTEVELDVVVKQ